MTWNFIIPMALLGFSASAMAADTREDSTSSLYEEAISAVQVGPKALNRSGGGHASSGRSSGGHASSGRSSGGRSSGHTSSGRTSRSPSSGSRAPASRGGQASRAPQSRSPASRAPQPSRAPQARGPAQAQPRTSTGPRTAPNRSATPTRNATPPRNGTTPRTASPTRAGSNTPVRSDGSPPSRGGTTTRPGTRPGTPGDRTAPGRTGTPDRGGDSRMPSRPGTDGRAAPATRPGTPARPATRPAPRPNSRPVASHGGRPAPVHTTSHGGRPAPAHTSSHGGHSTRVAGHGRGHSAGHYRSGHSHVRIHNVHPYHGVFVYGPRPVTHVRYQNTPSNKTVVVKEKDLPSRFVDRSNTLAVGLKAGSLWSGYQGATGYADVGMGLTGRYRPAESVGLELSLAHHDQTWTTGSERSQTLGSASVELFAYPWTRVSPYVIGGLTLNSRTIADEIYQFDGVNNIRTQQDLIGAHAGLGIEFSLGKTFALDLEGRYIGYLNKLPTDASSPGAFTTTAGLVAHF